MRGRFLSTACLRRTECACTKGARLQSRSERQGRPAAGSRARSPTLSAGTTRSCGRGGLRLTNACAEPPAMRCAETAAAPARTSPPRASSPPPCSAPARGRSQRARYSSPALPRARPPRSAARGLSPPRSPPRASPILARCKPRSPSTGQPSTPANAVHLAMERQRMIPSALCKIGYTSFFIMFFSVCFTFFFSVKAL